jgi:hypothetical protein
MAYRLLKRPQIVDRRFEIVEHPLVDVPGRLPDSCLANERAEFSLTAIAYSAASTVTIEAVSGKPEWTASIRDLVGVQRGENCTS